MKRTRPVTEPAADGSMCASRSEVSAAFWLGVAQPASSRMGAKNRIFKICRDESSLSHVAGPQWSMSLFRVAATAFALVLAGCGPSNPTVKALTGGTLMDGTGAAPIPDAVVVVNGNDIQAAGTRDTVVIPPDAKQISVKGKFIVPGLVDVRAALPADAAAAAPLLRALLKAGITSIGVADGGPALRDASPRTLPAGELASGVADHVIASGGSDPNGFFAKVDGMPPAQALLAATRNGALWLKQERLGVLATGRKADLLILNADPLTDIRNLRKIDRVMLDGSWVQ